MCFRCVVDVLANVAYTGMRIAVVFMASSETMSTRDIKRLTDQIKRLQQENDQQENDQQENDQQENDQPPTSLSEIDQAKMSDNYPDIVDLSDRNRPEKLAERYSEIYDNEWTDAFDELKTLVANKTDEEAIQTLLHILMTSYTVCRSEAQSQLKYLDCFGGKENLPVEVMKVLKDSRKHENTYKGQIKQVKPKVIEKLELSADVMNSVSKYVTSCVDLCWKLAIQDPPVYLQDPAQVQDKPFNKQQYREYTDKGDKVRYVLWPVMLVSENRGVLEQGVAQGY